MSEAETDVFVSYATKDAREIAEDLVDDLEARGVSCWIAPRDIPVGTQSWSSEIIGSIRKSRNFLLLLSEGANGSPEVEKEINEAARLRKTLFAVRVEDIEPSPGLGYHLNRGQLRDLFRNRELVLQEIVARIVALRAVEPAQPGIAPPQPRAPAGRASARRRKTTPSWIVGLAAGGAAAVVAVAALLVIDPSMIRRAVTGEAPAAPPASIASAPATAPAAPPAPSPAPAGPAQAAAPPAPAQPSPAQPAPVQPAPVSAPAEPAVTTAAAAPTVKEPEDIGRALSERLTSLYPEMRSAARRVADYVNDPPSKALMVFAPRETWRTNGWQSDAMAETQGLEACQIRFGGPCAALAVNDTLQPTGPDGALPLRSMPRVGYAGEFDAARIPAISDGARRRADVARYAGAGGPKAAALHPANLLATAFDAATQNAAEDRALADCEQARQARGLPGECFLYASGDQVVLPRRLTTPLTPPPPAPVAAAQPGPTPAIAAPPPAEAQGDALVATLTERLTRYYPSLDDPRSVAEQFARDGAHRMLAVAPPNIVSRSFEWPDERQAREGGLEQCEVRHGRRCELVAVGDRLEPLAPDGRPASPPTPRVSYAGGFDRAQIPTISDGARQRRDIGGYAATPGPKAAALYPARSIFTVATGAPSQREAEERALAECDATRRSRNFGGVCLLYAVGDAVVLPRRLTTPLTPPPQPTPVAMIAPPPASPPAAAPAPPSKPAGTAYDGAWSVVIACPDAPGGARGYNWRFPATVTKGRFVGQFNKPGQSPSGTLTGDIGADGGATLTMNYITGSSAYNLNNVAAGQSYTYTVRARFTPQAGSGERVESRVCNVAFTRA